MLEEVVYSEFSRITSNTEKKISYIINSIPFALENPVIKANLEDSERDFDNNLKHELLYLKNAYDYVDDIYIYNKKKNSVCSTNGIFSSEDFFLKANLYDSYNFTYWQNLDHTLINEYKLLFPSNIKTPENQSTVIPVIVRKSGNVLFDNIIIFNLDFKTLAGNTQKDDIIPDFAAFVKDNSTGDIISSLGEKIPAGKLSSDFYDKLNEPNAHFDFKTDEGKFTVISKTPELLSEKFSFFAMIPKKNLTPKTGASLWVIIIFSIVAGFIVLKNSSDIFNQLYRIFKILTRTNKQQFYSGNLLTDIHSYVSRMQEQNRTLSSALPLAQEKYLINYLNATEYYIDESARELIKESINFPNNYFAVAIIQISPTNQMFDLYNSFDYSNIQSGLYNIIKDLFAEKYECFILPGDKDTLYIILNLESKRQISGVDTILKNMYSLLETDMEYINLSIGKSDVYEGLVGLKTAHTQAVKSLTPHIYSSDRVIFDDTLTDDFEFSHKDESDFFTALVSFDSKKTYDIFNRIMEENSNIGPRSQKRLFNNLANIIIKAMRVKNIPFKDNKLDFEILNDILNQPPEGIKRDIETLIDYVLTNSDTKKAQSGTDVDEIVNYIRENFAFTDLSLEFLAGYFHTASSNISNLIKTNLGIGYHEYLTSLRIEAAKDLLIHSDKSITEIFRECGFNSQQTFYRTFKKSTGLTPLEFKNRKNS